MRRQGNGFGIIILLLVLAIVAFLSLNNFKATAPAAMQIQEHNKARSAGQKVESPSSSGDAWTATPPSRPSLKAMDQKTTEHSNTVQDALSQTE